MSKLFPFERSKGYLTRCIYGNVFGVGGTTEGCKINGKLLLGRLKKL
jgi:hypothetical protein